MAHETNKKHDCCGAVDEERNLGPQLLGVLTNRTPSSLVVHNGLSFVVLFHFSEQSLSRFTLPARCARLLRLVPVLRLISVCKRIAVCNEGGVADGVPLLNGTFVTSFCGVSLRIFSNF